MRAIAAREGKRAREERLEAQAAYKARSAAPATNGAGWSTKPDPARPPSGAERELSDRTEANRLAWTRRTPVAAKAERQIRLRNADLSKKWSHKFHGTPATHEEARREGALARLYRSGAIDADQLAWATEIAMTAERLGADVAVRTASLETRIDATRIGDEGFYEALGQVRREIAYGHWRKALGASAAPVLDMLVGDALGFTVVAKKYAMHNRRAKRLLIDALDMWPKFYGQAVKEIDAATLAAAHAGIL